MRGTSPIRPAFNGRASTFNGRASTFNGRAGPFFGWQASTSTAAPVVDPLAILTEGGVIIQTEGGQTLEQG